MTDDVCDICSGPCETCGRQMAESETARKWKQGDHPDVIAITYGRDHRAEQLVDQLLARKPVAEWAPLARRMLDRDLLSDDKFWWSLLALTDRERRKNPEPRQLPSYATRVTAAHQVMVAAKVADQLRNGRDPEPRFDATAPVDDIEIYDYPAAQRIAYARSGGACEADGLHHRNCPGRDDAQPDSGRYFITHHIYPREKAKQDIKRLRSLARHGDVDAAAEAQRITNLLDHPANLLVVFNGFTGLGAGGCHGRIHKERTLAKDLGLLAASLDHVSPTIPKG